MNVLVLGLVYGGIYGLIAVGIVLVYRGSRVLNFAQGEIGTFSLYAAYEVTTVHHLPWWLGALAAVASAVVVALLFEWLFVRRMVAATRVSVAVATVGLALFLLAVELKVFGISPRHLRAPVGGDGVKLGGVYVTPTHWLTLGVALVVALGLGAVLRRTDFGLGVVAAADDPVAVRLVGVPLRLVSAFTWGMGAALAAVAALLLEPQITVFAPGYGERLFVFGLVAALVGGLTSLPGAFLGGLIVGLVEVEVRDRTLTSTVPGLTSVAVFALILLVLLVRPRGLLGRSA